MWSFNRGDNNKHMETLNTLADWLAHCERLHPQAIDMGLARVKAVADRMGLAFECPVITVAGTNGKGSTCAMLEAILLQAGYRTGVYTSPHLIDFEERCRVRGDIVNAIDLIAHFSRVEKARSTNGSEISLSYFEFTTLAILSLLAEAKLDVVILEVGLGGRLDAVNILDADCAVITSIDLDHMELLGDNREAIGFEKAGIMRAGKPVVVSDPVPPQSILDHAARLGRRLVALWPGLQFFGRQAAMGLGRSCGRRAAPRQHSPLGGQRSTRSGQRGGQVQALCRAGLSRLARRQSVGQRRWRAGGADGLARSSAGNGASGARRAVPG